MFPPPQITPCLWFDSDAEAAAAFYTALFANSRIGRLTRYTDEGFEVTGKAAGSVLTIEVYLAGQKFTLLNGGPQFKFTPAISFFVQCETMAEVDTLWQTLVAQGEALMPLDRYDWSERYGWVKDKYGLTWQISLGEIADVGQKITPSLLFVGQAPNKAAYAINLYTATFTGSQLDGILRYAAGGIEPEGAVKHAQFNLSGQKFMAMDSAMAHTFGFNEAISFEIECGNQSEIDYYWHTLTANGGEESWCGWLKDPFGVSWQITPTMLRDYINDPDVARNRRVAKAMFKMQKLDLAVLQAAYAGVA